jgi:2,3-bisphosphoglycerate-independent phosphoglycerate mutase
MKINRTGPLALIIIDGWGYTPTREGNSIALATTPNYDEIIEKYPMTLLEASGKRVGLPAGVMGNSEVGHLNMGAGRVIRMDVSRIDYAIETGEFFSNPVIVKAMDNAKTRSGALHIMGLMSDGQVHSSIDHLYALLKMAKDRGLSKVYVHCFLDGRDTPPASAARYVKIVEDKCTEIGSGQVASVIGRYYAMDRDKNWIRTKRAYDLLVHAEGEKATSAIEAIKRSYERGVTDEFVEPIVIVNEQSEPVATIKDGDAVIFFNFRSDRARQLSRTLAVPDFKEFDVQNRPKIDFVCFTQYDATFPMPIAFGPQEHKNILAEVFSRAGVRNYRLAETEKYAHVTFFFNGGVEKEFGCERRLLVPSPKVATYDLMPEMSAYQVTDNVLLAIDEGETDVFVVNFANTDMVGHSGLISKTVEAVQHVDTCIGKIFKRILKERGTCLITADHGNCEQMIDFTTGQPHTAHTTNPVPFHLIDEASRGLKLREGGALEDISPTILGILGVDKPAEMTGNDLRYRG